VTFSLTGFDWQLFAYVWISVVATGLIVFLMTRRVSAGVPTVAQSMLEFVFEFIRDLGRGTKDLDADPFFFELLVMLFIFLLVANFEGMFAPLHSPTANVNVPVALALAVFIMTWYYGFRTHGLGYLKHWFQPPGAIGIAMSPINLLEDFAKPLTLAFRLFGNILVGEIFMKVLAGMGGWFYAGGFVGGFVWWGFTAFVNVIQAFIFMVLTLSYVAQAQGQEH
jgi:F-type H+-transporting ATPase subunit a